MSVVRLVDGPTLIDMPGMLRAAADRIEAGEHPDLRFIVAVFVDDPGVFKTYAWGEMASPLEGIGALALAAAAGMSE